MKPFDWGVGVVFVTGAASLIISNDSSAVRAADRTAPHRWQWPDPYNTARSLCLFKARAMASRLPKSLSALLQLKTAKFSAAASLCTKTVDVPLDRNVPGYKKPADHPADSSTTGKASATATSENKTYLWGRYNEMKKLVHGRSG